MSPTRFRAIFHADEAGLSWQRIAARLAERYADITAAAISAQLRELHRDGTR